MAHIDIEVTKRVTTSLYVSECPNCGILHGIPSDYEERRRGDGQRWYCPNGHCMSFTETREMALKKRNAALADEAERLRRDNLRLSDDLMTNAKELRRLKRRTHAGLCAICNRHFENVERHNKTKHPEAAK
jgi:hypothetical protein